MPTATILAVGPYDPDIVDLLEYQPHRYAKSRPGDIISTELGLDADDDYAAEELAGILGCDLEDPGTWCFEAAEVRVPDIADRFSEAQLSELKLKLEHLAPRGFKFLFRANI